MERWVGERGGGRSNRKLTIYVKLNEKKEHENITTITIKQLNDIKNLLTFKKPLWLLLFLEREGGLK